MSRIKKYKIGRRLGTGVFEKCQTQKFILSEQKRTTVRKGRKSQSSDYGMQLLEKQKVRFTYGLKERQLQKYIEKALSKKGNNLESLYGGIESRLDNVVYRLGLAETRAKARQVVSHGHITINGKRLNIPSYNVNNGEIIGIKAQSQNKGLFENFEERQKGVTVPNWLSFDIKKKEGKIVGVPKIGTGETFDLRAVFEFYRR
ncbi:30S ribosomal protein S4 [Candidatus Campbellbacteria bacterium RIFCSPLOWO2_02_FULL_35_11]|uniref:Small ribosomal subunit protein uS4 n=2 Tax=Candidatus Campbelliibacteriota TaxID=1752727 RepID=A0A1F5ENG5_9BACT|nr:MAG: 30S ribosomal protein S4 [Candidatus Campbellbacteria bacterium RIFCSPHIGHO2_12_FULL_35_10]OGD70418.1 MAG: 30S ribosomal protein S4 [Candidatus Campbellbacteria bacterium RIFCSPLOWO2_02_FULL_35_11]